MTLAQFIGQTKTVNFFLKLVNMIKEDKPLFLGSHFFTCLPGLGKTEIMDVIANAVQVAKANFHIMRIEAGTTATNFAKILSAYNDKHVVFILDEVAQFLKNQSPRKVALLRLMLETNNQAKKEFEFDGLAIVADRSKQLFLFASNDDPKCDALFGPNGRCMIHALEAYTDEEKLAIAKYKLSNGYQHVNVSDSALTVAMTRTLNNGRAIRNMLELLQVYGNVTKESVKEVFRNHSIFPEGWTKPDLLIMLRLATSEKGCQVNELSAVTGEDGTQTSDRLRWLSAKGYIQTYNGRKLLTAQGAAYLKGLKSSQTTQRDLEASNLVPVTA